MKIFLYVGAIAAIFAGIAYGSFYVMGGIEAGLPGGGHEKFADYHDGNKVTKFFQGEPMFSSGWSSSDYTQGEVTSNPFAEK